MSWLKRKIAELKHSKEVKKLILEVEQLEQELSMKALETIRMNYVNEWVREYNGKNDIPIPEWLVDDLYELAQRKIKGQKAGDIKKKFVEKMMKEIKGYVIKYLPVIIEKLVWVLINKYKKW